MSDDSLPNDGEQTVEPRSRAKGKPRNWKRRLEPAPEHGYEVCVPWHPDAELDALWDFSDVEQNEDG